MGVQSPGEAITWVLKRKQSIKTLPELTRNPNASMAGMYVFNSMEKQRANCFPTKNTKTAILPSQY